MMNAEHLSDDEVRQELKQLNQEILDQQARLEAGQESLSRGDLRGKMSRFNRLKVEARRRGLVEE